MVHFGCRWLSAVIAALASLVWTPLWAQVPEGFTEVTSAAGCVLYRKDYPGGQPDFVVTVDLSAARVEQLTGAVADAGAGQGPLGGPNPTFERHSLAQLWDMAKAADSAAFAVVNGQFFSTASNPTPLAFSVKSGGEVVSDGYGVTNEFPGELLLLRWDGPTATADVTALSADALHAEGSPPEQVGGLDVAANKGPGNYVGRTFAGFADGGDGPDRLLLFSSSFSTQPGAAEVLTGFGATAMVMLDGGGSSQLIVAGDSKVSSTRAIPHALVVIAEPPEQPPPPPADDPPPVVDEDSPMEDAWQPPPDDGPPPDEPPDIAPVESPEPFADVGPVILTEPGMPPVDVSNATTAPRAVDGGCVASPGPGAPWHLLFLWLPLLWGLRAGAD